MPIPIDQDFYYPKDLFRYPQITREVVKRLVLRMAELIYPEEYKRDALDTVKRRIFIADVEAGGDVMSGESFEKYKSMFPPYPFTAYNIVDVPVIESMRGVYAHTNRDALSYFHSIGANGVSVPLVFNMPIYTFFADVDDYYRALSYSNWDAFNFSKLQMPIMIGDPNNPLNPPRQFNYVFTYALTTNKASLAGGFEEYLRTNDIWDVSLNLEVHFNDLIFDTGGIYPVEDIKLFMKEMNNPIRIVSKEEPGGIISEQPQVATSVPVDKAINVLKTDNIVITFDMDMIRPSVESGITISPATEVRYNWDDWSKILTIEPWIEFLPNTLYTVTIAEGMNAWGQELLKPYTFTFTTGP